MSKGRLVFIGLLISLTASAQEVKVKADFLTDSLRIGEPVPFAISVRYPSDKFILLPDSTGDFGRFEYRYRRWFPTKTRNGISTDSAIYWVASFELDSLQLLELSAVELAGGDSIRHPSGPGSIFLSRTADDLPPTIQPKDLPLKSDTGYWDVLFLFNYPLWSIAGGIFLVALASCWIIFGAAIRRYFLRRKLTAGFGAFNAHFASLLDTLKHRSEPETAEALLGVWKAYMEQLENKPYRKLTSREIHTMIGQERVTASLAVADRLIYGGIRPSSFDAFHELRSFSEDRYHSRLEALRNPQPTKA